MRRHFTIEPGEDLTSESEEDRLSPRVSPGLNPKPGYVGVDSWAGWKTSRNYHRDEKKPSASSSAAEPASVHIHRAPSTESTSSIHENWLIQPGDTIVHLDLDAGLDINPDLELLARLNRQGHFDRAATLFKERLAPHTDFFPVVAEYADILLEQGNFRGLHQFITDQIEVRREDSLAVERRLLLELLQSLAKVHVDGTIIPALSKSKEAIEWLNISCADFDPPNGAQIQLVDVLLRIIAYADAHSDFLRQDTFQVLLAWRFSRGKRTRLRDRDMKAASFDLPTPQLDRHYPDIFDWYQLLVEKGYLWESHRILRSMLPLLGDSHGHYRPSGGEFERFANITTVAQASDVFIHDAEGCNDEEQFLLTELANASLLASFLSPSHSYQTLAYVRDPWFDRSRFIASLILEKRPHLINSRPYLNWLFLQGPGRIVDSDTTSPVMHQGLGCLIPSSGFFNKLQHLSTCPHGIVLLVDANGSAKREVNGSQRCIEQISTAAKENGDYILQQAALQLSYQNAQGFDRQRQFVKDSAALYDTMQDMAGYLRCLVTEYLLLKSFGATDVASSSSNLELRLASFSKSLPSWYDYDIPTQTELGVFLVDNPLVEWMRRKAWSSLLRDLGQHTEERLVLLKLPYTGVYLPWQIAAQLGLSNPPPPPPLSPSHHPVTLNYSGTTANYSGTTAGPLRDAASDNTEPSWSRVSLRRRAPCRIIADKKSPGEEDDITEMLQAAKRPRRRTRFVSPVRDRMAENSINESTSELVKNERNWAVPVKTTQEKAKFLTVKDPVGRTFVFLWDQTRTFAEADALIRQVFANDTILAPRMAKEDFEFTGPDGRLISRYNWTSMVQPGWNITVRFISDKGVQPFRPLAIADRSGAPAVDRTDGADEDGKSGVESVNVQKSPNVGETLNPQIDEGDSDSSESSKGIVLDTEKHELD